MENKEIEQQYHCECCHCKKIFMFLVLLLLAFIAGIMVGHCQSMPYGYHQPHHAQFIPIHKKQQIKPKKIHHHLQQMNSQPSLNEDEQPEQNSQMGGFVVEID